MYWDLLIIETYLDNRTKHELQVTPDFLYPLCLDYSIVL